MIPYLEKKSNSMANLVSIRNILTIRCDISKKSVKKLAVVRDFEKSSTDLGGTQY